MLDDLYHSLEPEVKNVSAILEGSPLGSCELFRLSWPIMSEGDDDLHQFIQSERTGTTSSNVFVYRWSFFDERERATQQQIAWLRELKESSEAAKTFIDGLSSLRGYLSLGTQDHLERLSTKFFDPKYSASGFLEDWRALYLQSPTTGTMLQDLWEYTQDPNHSKPSGFIVRPVLPTNEDFPPFEFLAFFQEPREAEFQNRQRQKQIHLLSDDNDPPSGASDFFQKELYPHFYDANLPPGKSTPRLLEKIKYFLFLPLYISYEESSRQWLGVLQIRFGPNTAKEQLESLESSNLRSDDGLRKAITQLGRIVQLLTNDLIVAHIQEACDRPLSHLPDPNAFRQFKEILGIGKTAAYDKRAVQFDRSARYASLVARQRAQEAKVNALQHALKGGTTNFLYRIYKLTKIKSLWMRNQEARLALSKLWPIALTISGPQDIIGAEEKGSNSYNTLKALYDSSLRPRFRYYKDCAKVSGVKFTFPQRFPHQWDIIKHVPLRCSQYLIVGVCDVLFCNAIQHSGGTRIQIRTDYNDGCVWIIVEDNGQGISDLRARVFGRQESSGSSSVHFGLPAAKRALVNSGLDLILLSNKAKGADWTSIGIKIPVKENSNEIGSAI